MPDETIASKLTDLATELSGVLTDINTALTAKEVSPADTLDGVPDQISAIETGSGGITPTGTKSITTNGTHDVTTYASANVNVPTGTAKTASDITVSGNTVTVPAGLYSAETTKSVATANHVAPTISVNTSTGRIQAEHRQTTGYVVGSNLSTIKDQTTQAAQTIHPSLSQQTISSGVFLTGTQTIKAVQTTNLVPGYIKNGVTIKIGDSSDDDCVTSVTGTYSATTQLSSGDGSGYYVMASRSGAKAMTFTGFTVPSGKTLVGVMGVAQDAGEGSYSLLQFVAFTSAMGNLGFCITRNDQYTPYYYNDEFALTINGGSGSIIINGDSRNSFNSGQYYLKPIYAS